MHEEKMSIRKIDLVLPITGGVWDFFCFFCKVMFLVWFWKEINAMIEFYDPFSSEQLSNGWSFCLQQNTKNFLQVWQKKYTTQ